MMRQFKIEKAVREMIPLNIGLWSPSGGGKTFSALRLATGIQRVFPGNIVLVDTENKRGKHYADDFEYQHVDFVPPFSPTDYMEMFKQIEVYNPSIVIVDSMSHEHSWILEEHEKVSRELAKEWKTTPYKAGQAAWGRVKTPRKKLVEYLTRTPLNVILCFRAKEKTATVEKNGKTTIENIGYQPIAGREYVYEMSVSALLYPGSEGRAYFRTGKSGEDMMTKLEDPMKKIFPNDGIQITEDIGEQLARWAKGDSKPVKKTPAKKPVRCPELDRLEDYLIDGFIQDKIIEIRGHKVNLLTKAKGAMKYLRGLTEEFNKSTSGYADIQTVIKIIEADKEPEELDVSREKDQAPVSEQDELDIF